MLALINIMPLAALTIGTLGYLSGSIKLKPNADQGLIPVLVALGACLVVAFSCWMILPAGQWLRDWPQWHYARRNKALWCIPMLLGRCAQILLRIIAYLAMLIAIAMLGLAIVRLWQVVG